MAPLREEVAREGIRALAFIPLVYQGRLLGKFMVYFDHVRLLTTEERRLAETIGRHMSFGLEQVRAHAETAEALDRERAARSEAVAARAEAEQASRAKDEFLAMLAHELRNPLGVIVNAVAILKAVQKAPDPELGLTVSMIDRQSKHLARLLDDLLDVARITSGRIELDPQRLDLATVVNLAVEAQRVRITHNSQHLTVSLPSEPVEVMGDPVRLQQVVGNLVNNASKYTPRAGSIWVELVREDSEAVVRVRDSGAGIPPDRLNSIFDLFVQASPTLARTEGGLGVGLTLVRRLVALHEGHVDGRSAGPGEGAEFTVRLPLAGTNEVFVNPIPVSAVSSPKRILVVEDSDDGRAALAGLLRLDGHEVCEAATGRAAVAMAEHHQPDVVLLDIGLPDIDGYTVGQALRASFGARIHLVALTGYGQPTDRIRALEVGFEAHLVKPVLAERLTETIASLS
jgi:signal transduction histidine kinase